MTKTGFSQKGDRKIFWNRGNKQVAVKHRMQISYKGARAVHGI